MVQIYLYSYILRLSMLQNQAVRRQILVLFESRQRCFKELLRMPVYLANIFIIYYIKLYYIYIHTSYVCALQKTCMIICICRSVFKITYESTYVYIHTSLFVHIYILYIYTHDLHTYTDIPITCPFHELSTNIQLTHLRTR